VDVSIKQIPTLKKIVYMPGAYANGSFQGKAYYRFGDVVSRPGVDYEGRDITEYWICVRPSFGPESKGDSHWVCVNVLPKKNTWHHDGSNEREYFLPTNIGTNEEHMQNLAELLYAIYFPEKWEENITRSLNNNGKLKMFHDFSPNKMGYHNMNFWTNVREQWRDHDILKKAFNFRSDEQVFKDMLEDDGLRLLYKGYSWWTTTSWNCTLYEAHFQNGTDLKEKNMHKVSYDKPNANMQGFAMDCRMMGDGDSIRSFYDNYKQFFNDDNNYRWTVRHATGKELAARGYGYDQQSKIEGVDNVYRYYHNAYPVEDLTEAGPEETSAEVDRNHPRVGYIIGKNGHFYKSYDMAEIQGGGAKAMVVYLGGDERVEKDKDWNGLAIALKDLQDNEAFCEAGMDKELCTTNAAIDKHMFIRLDGWAMTKKLKDHACNPNHRHPAAEAVWNLEKPDGCSEWFIPSTGQWNLALKGQGFGGYTYIEETDQWVAPNTGKWLWYRANVPEEDARLYYTGFYMTCTEKKAYNNIVDYNNSVGLFYVFKYSIQEGPVFETKKKTNESNIRPFIAFKYGNGGNQDPQEIKGPLAEPKAKSWLGNDGLFYEKSGDALNNTYILPVGYVAYYGAPGSVDVDGKKYRALVISISNEDFPGLAWNHMNEYLEQYKTNLPDNVRQEKGFSSWFVGNKEHWQMALEQGFGLEFQNDSVQEDVEGSKQSAMDKVFRDYYLRSSILSGPYWTATANNEGEACYIDLIEGHTIHFQFTDMFVSEIDGEQMRIRPMMAF